jgi:hypothetical protein
MAFLFEYQQSVITQKSQVRIASTIGKFAVGGCSIRNSGPPNNAQGTAALGRIIIDMCRTKTR